MVCYHFGGRTVLVIQNIDKDSLTISLPLLTRAN
jgi:hypothetical protein